MARTSSGMGKALGGLLLLGLLCAAVALAPSGTEAKKKTTKKQRQPNIVLVMTDDQHEDSARFMPELQRLIAGRGVTFDNSFVSYSLCCPSRATWLTGQYAHNHDVRGNTAPAGGYGKIAPFLSNSLPAWLQRAGYYTGHIGKFLNGYGNTSPDTEVPAGWSEWYGALDDPDAYTGGTYTMYGYTLNENGSVVHYGSTPDVVDPATYQTDVYSTKAADFIRRRAPKNKPFFLSVAPLASHGESSGACACTGNNPRAAPRHEGRFAAEPLPRPPDYNEADVSDKPQTIQDLTSIGAAAEQQIELRYRARLESLLAVDDMIANLVGALGDKGELKNTVFMFTSDNGFFHGEHRVRQGKVRLYEPSIRVPLIIRGPGVPKGKHRSQPVANVDLAPTILDFADAKAQRREDGRSLLPLIDDKLLRWGRAILLEAFFNADPDEDPETPPTNYTAVRTDRYLYARYGTGERELYDLETDPFELQSRHADTSLAPVSSALDQLLSGLVNCNGGSCQTRPALKLKVECLPSGFETKLRGKDAHDLVFTKTRIGTKRSTALVTTQDGRRTTVTAKTPRC